MAKVIAVFEVVRPGETIKPGAVFTATGDDLDYLMKVGAVRKPTKEDGNVIEPDDHGTEGDVATLEDRKAATYAKTEAAKVATPTAKSPATTGKATTAKAPAKGSKSDDDGI